MYKIQTVSAMEKILISDCEKQFEPIKQLRALKGERISFQICIQFIKDESERYRRQRAFFSLRSPLRKATSVARVGQVPVALPAYTERCDNDYISKQPGLYPDVLFPVKARELFHCDVYAPTVLMVTADIPEDQAAGTYPLYFTFTVGESEKHSLRVDVKVEDLAIAKNDLLFTQWFHCDSIASYHNVKMMSEKHWHLIEQYIKTAARTGITMLLTPIFTPPLDTEIGGERPTMQLVKIKKENDRYEFDFSLLERWIRLCQKYGIHHFEMAHLFTQWGAGYCPKIVVESDGKQVKEFGWHTEAMGDGYKNFLAQFLPALTKALKDFGVADKTYFHLSDEPRLAPDRPDYQNYLAAKTFIAPYLKEFKHIDALSHIEFYKNGLIQIPICATNRIEPFIEEDIKERWCYYCCSQGDQVSNRFIAMPSYRTRILGIQLFQADMSGFLQWGYNFYFNERARMAVDPYYSTDALMTWPAGDPFSVYPYQNQAIESLRTVIFYQGIQDRTLLKMLSQKIGHEETKKWVNEYAGMKVDFKHYPKNNEFIENLHDKILDRLLEK